MNHSRPPADPEIIKMVRRGIRAVGRAPGAEARSLYDHIFGPWQSAWIQRAVGRAPEAEVRSLYDHIFGPWQSASIQNAVAHLSAGEEDRWLAIALKYCNDSRSRMMSNKQKGSARKRSQNLEARNHWIREQYDQRKNRHRRYSFARFRSDLEIALDLGRLEVPLEVLAQLRPKGQLLSEQSLEKIVKPH